MSAELYDAEMAGALARPAIDVLPGRKAPGSGPTPTAKPELPEVPALEPVSESAVVPPAPVEPEAVADAAPAHEEPRKFLGMQVRRHRKQPEQVADVEDEAPIADVAEATEVPNPFSSAVPKVEPVAVPTVAEEPVADAAEETRALRALLEASEQQRAAAETRAAQAVAYAQQAQSAIQQAQAQAAAAVEKAEAQVRSNANEAQDWQIRHREAETTIAELAASVANAESRMAELREQVAALSTERDELLAALEDATSPDRAQA